MLLANCTSCTSMLLTFIDFRCLRYALVSPDCGTNVEHPLRGDALDDADICRFDFRLHVHAVSGANGAVSAVRGDHAGALALWRQSGELGEVVGSVKHCQKFDFDYCLVCGKSKACPYLQLLIGTMIIIGFNNSISIIVWYVGNLRLPVSLSSFGTIEKNTRF